MVTGAATNPNLTKPGYKTTFRIIANDNALALVWRSTLWTP